MWLQANETFKETHLLTTYFFLLQVLLTPNSEWGGEGSLGCGIGYGYLHRIPERDTEQQPADPEIGGSLPQGGKGAEPAAAPPTGEDYTDVSTTHL